MPFCHEQLSRRPHAQQRHVRGKKALDKKNAPSALHKQKRGKEARRQSRCDRLPDMSVGGCGSVSAPPSEHISIAAHARAGRQQERRRRVADANPQQSLPLFSSLASTPPQGRCCDGAQLLSRPPATSFCPPRPLLFLTVFLGHVQVLVGAVALAREQQEKDVDDVQEPGYNHESEAASKSEGYGQLCAKGEIIIPGEDDHGRP